MSDVFFKNWSNQIRKGILELAILNDIHHRKSYAYDIERKFRKSYGVSLSSGAIYNILKRFKRNRLVKTTAMKSPDGPNRKCYKLTSAGVEVLAQMNSYWHAVKQHTDSVKKAKP